LSSLTQVRPADTILAKRQLFESLKDRSYRFAFVPERVRSSIALQIRALREQRNQMTQKQLGDALGMAQTWVSKLENPEYGKMAVATLLRLAEAFDTDLEIKFRPFSQTIHTLPVQGPQYFKVPSFEEEKRQIEFDLAYESAREKRPTFMLRLLAGLKPAEANVTSMPQFDREAIDRYTKLIVEKIGSAKLAAERPATSVGMADQLSGNMWSSHQAIEAPNPAPDISGKMAPAA
jgi:transcriptional regulator with XRE-family HTH domain